MEVKLVVLTGKQKNREIPLPRTIFLIGRGKECHLRVHSELVSRRHCAIACWAGKVSVRDLKSANGTLINNQRIVGEVKVRDGDRLQVGPLAFAFRIKNPQPDELPKKIAPGSLRWLAEQDGEAPPLDPEGSTILGAFPENSEEATNDSSVRNASLSPGAYIQRYL